MKSHQFIKYFSIATIPFVIGCAETNQDKIRDAQVCLDKATAATASACMTKVNGLTSQASYLIRCSAIMIKQGLTDPTKLSSILTAMSSGSSPTATAMDAIKFTASGGAASDTNDLADSTNASSYCYLAGSPGLNTLAFLASFATISSQAGSNNPAAMTTYTHTNAATLANTGSNAAMMAASYQQNCTGSSSAYSAFCTQYRTAINNTSGGAANTTGVAQYFLANLN